MTFSIKNVSYSLFSSVSSRRYSNNTQSPDGTVGTGILSNSLYVNDNVNSIQSQLDNVVQGDTIYISSGSYDEPLINITDKINISLISPSCNHSTICEILNGLSVDGTSDGVRLSNLQLKGSSNTIKGVGNHVLNNIFFTGTTGQTNTIEFGENSIQFITVLDCEFDQFCNIKVSNLFESVIYFTNCNFSSSFFTLSNVNNSQVIFNNCVGFTDFPPLNKCTLVGLNTLVSGTIQNNVSELKTVNANIAVSGNLNFELGSYISINSVSSSTSVNEAIVTDGVSGLKFAPYPTSSLFYVDGYSGQYTETSTDNPLTIYSKVEQLNITPLLKSIISFSLNLNVSGGDDTLTLILKNDTTLDTLATLVYQVPNGNQIISGKFFFMMPDTYIMRYSIVGSLTTYDITINTSMAYNIIIYQILQ
jgi:hypothetical protein